MIKTVLFDLDGTLLNTIDDLADAGNWVCAQHGWPTFTVEQFKHMVGNGIPKLVERFSPENARTPEQLAATLAEFTARYDAHKEDKTAPYPGIPELLDELRAQGVQCAVFSNKADPLCGKIIATISAQAACRCARQQARRAHQTGPRRAVCADGRDRCRPLCHPFCGRQRCGHPHRTQCRTACHGRAVGFRGRAELTAAGADALAAVPEDIFTYIKNN